MKKLSLDDDTNDFVRLAKSKLQPSLFPEHETKWQVFKFEEPELTPPKKRGIARLCTTDISIATIQKLEEGGETKLHSHSAQDGFFMVLKGRAIFTGDQGEEYPLGPLEGVMVPRGTVYAFRKSGDEPLLLLQVEAIHPSAKANVYRMPAKEEGYKTPMSERIEFFDARVDVT